MVMKASTDPLAEAAWMHRGLRRLFGSVKPIPVLAPRKPLASWVRRARMAGYPDGAKPFALRPILPQPGKRHDRP